MRVDGDGALGQVAAHRALEAAPIAKESGLAGVAVWRSNHSGAAACYYRIACREGLALIATLNSTPGIASWGGGFEEESKKTRR